MLFVRLGVHLCCCCSPHYALRTVYRLATITEYRASIFWCRAIRAPKKRVWISFNLIFPWRDEIKFPDWDDKRKWCEFCNICLVWMTFKSICVNIVEKFSHPKDMCERVHVFWYVLTSAKSYHSNRNSNSFYVQMVKLLGIAATTNGTHFIGC